MSLADRTASAGVRGRMRMLRSELAREDPAGASIQLRLVEASSRLRSECERNGFGNFDDPYFGRCVQLLRQYLVDDAARIDPSVARALEYVAAADTSVMFDGEPGFDEIDAAVLAWCDQRRGLVDAAGAEVGPYRVSCFDRPLEESASPYWTPRPFNSDERVLEHAVASRPGTDVHLLALRELLDEGANPDSTLVSSRRTALHSLARMRGRDSRVVDLLLSSGANPMRLDLDGKSAFYRGLKEGDWSRAEQWEWLKIMLAHGMDLGVRTAQGIPVMFFLAGNPVFVKGLCDRRVWFDAFEVHPRQDWTIWSIWQEDRMFDLQRAYASAFPREVLEAGVDVDRIGCTEDDARA